MNPPQILVNTLVFGAELGVIAIGLSLSYSILRFANFAHVELVTVGAYFALLGTRLNIPFVFIVPVAVAVTGVTAVVIDRAVFRRMRLASTGTKMIASIALALAIRSVLQVAFGAEAYDLPAPGGTLPQVAGARMTVLQATIIGATLAVVVSLHLGLRRTRLGRALRACADNFTLALSRGIPGERMISLAWFLSGASAAIGGILVAMETQLRPVLGGSMVMQTFAAASVGGLGNPFGAVGGALLLSSAQNVLLGVDFGSIFGLGEFRLSVNYKDALALVVLVITLLIRPTGLFSTAPASR